MMKKSLLALAVTAGLAAASMPAAAVQVNSEGWGQVLLGPIYTTTSADAARNVVRVVNTDNTSAVKVKAVLRSSVHSQECRDLILYLTPGDVAAFDIVPKAGTRSATVTSTDDSLLSGLNGATPVFATQTAYNFDTVDGAALAIAGDTCAQGHIELIGVYRIPNGTYNAFNGDTVTVRQGMTKGDLYKLFGSPSSTNDNGGRAYLNGQTSRTDGRFVAGVSGTRAAFTTDNGIRLIGSNDIETRTGEQVHVPFVPLIGDQAVQNINGVNTNVTVTDSVGGATRRVNDLIATEGFDATVSAQTPIGLGWGVLATDNIGDIEEALAADNVWGIYDNDAAAQKSTNLLVTFPTRYRHLLANNTYSAPFQASGSMEYAVTAYDHKEFSQIVSGCFQSPCGSATRFFITDEVNYIGGAFMAERFFLRTDAAGQPVVAGWYDMRFVGLPHNRNLSTGTVVRANVPTIAYSHRIVKGQSFVERLAIRDVNQNFR